MPCFQDFCAMKVKPFVVSFYSHFLASFSCHSRPGILVRTDARSGPGMTKNRDGQD